MIKEFIGTGSTVEEATLAARLGLNAPEDADIKFETISIPKKKFLGLFGGAQAEIRAYYDDGVSEVKAPKKQKTEKKDKKPTQQNSTAAKQQSAKKPASKQPEKKAEPKTAPKAASVEKSEAKEPKEKDFAQSVDLEYAKSYLAEIIKGLKVDNAKISASYSDGVITMDVDCEEYGIIIGRRGETLDSIQYLLSLAMKKNSNGYVRVSINTGDYRERRNETLRALAKKNAQRVLATGRRYTFEPMNPYERRIIHTTIQEIEGVTSNSIGTNQDRRVVLEPEGGVKPRNGARRGQRRPQSKPAATTAPTRAPKADRADMPKFGKIEVPSKD